MFDRKWLYAIVGLAAVAVLATAGGLYVMVSSRTGPSAADVAPRVGVRSPATEGNSVPAAAVPSIEAAADRLAQRLKANDGTADDWALLARSYVQMRRYEEAVDAFGKALQKMPGNQAFIDEQAAAKKAAGGAAPPK
jgi:cytochrome c-type biogenesis protein CcmH/NrfG